MWISRKFKSKQTSDFVYRVTFFESTPFWFFFCEYDQDKQYCIHLRIMILTADSKYSAHVGADKRIFNNVKGAQ